MGSNGKLFRPTVGESAMRDPVSNAQMNGNIMNPPRFAELGGYSNADRGAKKNEFRIVRPGASTKRVPVSSS